MKDYQALGAIEYKNRKPTKKDTYLFWLLIAVFIGLSLLSN